MFCLYLHFLGTHVSKPLHLVNNWVSATFFIITPLVGISRHSISNVPHPVSNVQLPINTY